MSKRLFRKGDEVTLVSGDFMRQLKYWKDKKATVDRNEEDYLDCYITITSKNDYHNCYPRENLRLTKANKTTERNRNFIKKQKKDFVTTYLIQNFTVITKEDMEQ